METAAYVGESVGFHLALGDLDAETAGDALSGFKADERMLFAAIVEPSFDLEAHGIGVVLH